MTKRAFKILAIDGGGVRGAFAAQILKRIKEKLGKDISKEFDIIAGTSTGAIVAAGMAIDYPPQKMLNLYRVGGKKIFRQSYSGFLNLNNWKALFRSKYEIASLKEALQEMYGDILLSQAKTDLIILASDIISGNPFIFKSKHEQYFALNNDIKLVDAVLASCSVPIFFDPALIKGYLLVDGCLWANNPSLVALMEAMGKNFNQDKENIKIFSLGTGINKNCYDAAEYPKHWGASQWGVRLIGSMMNLQSTSINNAVRLILNNDEQLLRIDFDMNPSIALDDPDVVDSLIAIADEEFSINFERIKNFFETKK